MTSDSLTADESAALALAAIDASVRPAAWENLSDLVAERLDAAAFMVFAYDPVSPAVPLFYGSQRTRTPEYAALTAELLAGGGEEDHPACAALARVKSGVALQEGELLGRARGWALPANVWRERVLDASGGRARSIMRINDHGPFLDVAVAHEGAEFGAGPPAMARLTPLLGSLLARALESSRVLAALTASHARLMTLFDQLDFGAAFCTPEGRVLTANAPFRRSVADRDGLCQAQGLLSASNVDGARLLQGALAAAVRPDSKPDRLTFALPRSSERLPLVLRAAPMRNGDLGSATVVLLLVVDPEDETRLKADGLTAFGVLTPAEFEVCELLVRGFETKNIAKQRGTGTETTRDQIKSATAKLACRSRLDLVRLAMATDTPVKR